MCYCFSTPSATVYGITVQKNKRFKLFPSPKSAKKADAPLSCPESGQLSLQLCHARFSLCHTSVLMIKKKLWKATGLLYKVWLRNLLKQPTPAVSHSNVWSVTKPAAFLYLCKSICLFVPSSLFCFDTLLLTESADELESATLFLPRPAPPVGVPFSAVPEAAAADLGGRPRRLTGGVSISALGAAFWLGSTWVRRGTPT